nr:MAG TPA: N-acetylmuramoyl-L-alanine amidase [Caudoviricetes sp.]
MKITDALLTPNKYSRPQIPLKSVKKVVLHYVGNPKSSAMANRNYFENQKNGGRYVSSHYIVGLSGEILRCVPENEVAYCSNQANTYSISIECCHPDATGKFTDATTDSAAELCAYLLKKYGLSVNDLIRHYDVTGKQCPLWFVPTKYQSADVANARWAGFKALVSQKMECNVPTKQETSFKVKILDNALNVRKAAGVGNPIVGVIHKGEVYTIVEVKSVGSAEWGKLKSGLGWVNIGAKYVKRLGGIK